MTAIISGEAVTLELAPAGVGSRLIAAFIDLFVEFGILLLFAIIAAAGLTDAAASAVAISGLVIAFAGYPIVFEWLSRGKSLGKMALGLRVVRTDGGPIGLRQALVRGLSGLLLEKPGLVAPLGTAAGALTSVRSQRCGRIGDHMAGTFVVNERIGTRASSLAAVQFWVPPQLQPWAMSLDLTRLDDSLALGVRQFMMRINQLSPNAQFGLGEDLRRRVEAVITPAAPVGVPTAFFLATVLAERRRRGELAAGRWH